MKYLITLIIIGLIVCAWSPWLDAKETHQLINNKIYILQKKYPNLCPIKVKENTIKKILFGYKEVLYYDCSEIDDEYGVEKSTNTIFVTFYGEIIGMPSKFIKK